LISCGKDAEKTDKPLVCDTLVYGSTPSGIVAAAAAQVNGAKTIVISQTDHVGGMITGGLGRTDVGERKTVGGLSAKLLNEIAAATPKEKQTPGRPWDLEAKVASAVFDKWIAENKIEIIKSDDIKEVSKVGKRIESVTLQSGKKIYAKNFIDASYEGDLMAKAGVSYAVGREGKDVYDEPNAGFQIGEIRFYTQDDYAEPCTCLGGNSKVHYLHNTQFGADIPARGADGKVMWGVNADIKPQTGAGDNKTQAYNFRVPATQRVDILVKWPKPDNYVPARYELLLKYIEAHPHISFYKLVHFGRLPNGKFDINASGPFTTDYVGGNTEYPDANLEKRKAIWKDHEDYQKGFFYFLANDERVPENIRAEANKWGLCKDEFANNAHWPTQLYVREARRMKGAYVMTQRDITNERSKSDAVAIGSFSADSHPIQRYIDDKGFVREEGHLLVAAKPYEIPFKSITPKKDECENLLVTVCMSASHVAYCSIRMEPVYMAMGHAAGTAAGMQVASQKLTAVQDLDYTKLSEKLKAEDHIFKISK